MLRKLSGLIITGFMGTGKTTVGKSVSQILDMEFVDLDVEIEKETGMKISDIFSEMGEAGFREIEKKTLRNVLNDPGKVVSTGGGTIIDSENLKLMKSYGMVICLWAMPEEVRKRLKGFVDRPLLNGENNLENISKLMEARKTHYLSADISIQTDERDVEAISEEIVSLWREKVDR